jgi:alkanesulfonate monooxygenase SsuD/methylene tetrahydromethanopterin reductase-like flavin-dependent oxidoreductase (luciferase family)
MRFDMRAPATGAPTADLYRAALDMAAWAEDRGAVTAIVCEHHGLSDGYLPAPMTLATALAARTTTLPITVAVVLLPLYHPVRLAEEMVVLDVISGGRVGYVAAIGYRPEEYEMFGVDFHRRGRIAEEHLGVLLQAVSGESFEHEGRRIRVTPAPVTPGGPRVAWGGGSEAAARRAGRHGLDFLAQSDAPGLREAYEDEARAHGREPGWCLLPSPEEALTVFVADDLDRAWDELGPYLLHDAA